jgi:hypothetical protein
MAHGEVCKMCGYQETAHDIAHSIRYEDRSKCAYLNGTVTREDALKREFGSGDLPCESFESEVSHSLGCPVILHRDGRDYYCQGLEGGCEQMIRIDNFDEEPPDDQLP